MGIFGSDNPEERLDDKLNQIISLLEEILKVLTEEK